MKTQTKKKWYEKIESIFFAKKKPFLNPYFILCWGVASLDVAEIIVPDKTKETAIAVATKMKQLCESEGLVCCFEGNTLS